MWKFRAITAMWLRLPFFCERDTASLISSPLRRFEGIWFLNLHESIPPRKNYSYALDLFLFFEAYSSLEYISSKDRIVNE